MTHPNPYHYTECGLSNIFLLNGYKMITTPRGQAVSITDIDGLHQAIGLFLVNSGKGLLGEEIRFLRHELLMSQSAFSILLGVSGQAIHRWESAKANALQPSEEILFTSTAKGWRQSVA